MKFGVKILFAAVAAWALCSCGGNSSDDGPAITIQSMRFGQASYSVTPGGIVTPPILVRIDGGSEIEYNGSMAVLALSWDIADKSVATVSNMGAVTGVKIGKTTLTVRSPYFASPVTTEIVVAREVESMRFEKSAYDIYNGTTVTPQLYVKKIGQVQEEAYDHAANVYGVTWDSSDPSVATVSDKGTVTCKKVGKTTLTAHMPNLDNPVTTVINVLSAADVQIESMRFEQATYSLEAFTTVTPKLFLKLKSQAEAMYDLAVNPYGVVLTPTDNTIISVSGSGIVTGLKSGTTILTASSPLSASVKATTSVTCTASWVGEWVIESWKDDVSMAGKVYMGLVGNGIFNLYQNINTPGFTALTGSYKVAMESGKSVLSGVYSDQVPWAEKYSISLSADKAKLTMTGLTTGLVSVYSRTTIPPYVKNSARKLSVGESQARFL